MTTTNNWPGKPGVPLNPEKDGWHWLKTPDNEVIPFEWRVAGECERGRWPSYWVRQGEDCWTAEECEYIGPCLTPDEATALQARADRNAAGFARVDAEAERAKFLHKQEIAALQKRCEEAERERDALRRDASQQVATDEMVRRLQHLGDWQAADRIDALQKRVAELEAALRNARARYIELSDKDAAEAMAEIINEALGDVK